MKSLLLIFFGLLFGLSQVLAEEPAAAEVFGVPVTNDVLFIIDASSSMDEEFGLHSRFGAAINEVIRAIELLPENLRFSVAAIDEGIHWVVGNYQLHAATPENKKILISAIEDLETGKGSNFEISLALPIVYTPRPTQVILISDSSPDDFEHLDEIEALAADRIRVDCIGIQLSRQSISHYREIAHSTGGKFVFADSPDPIVEPERFKSAGIE